jgi:multiple antibiotic resistance protein
MLPIIQSIPFAFAALFPVINPIGSSIIFLALIRGASSKAINYLAVKVAVYTSVMLGIVMFVGSLILHLFGITIPIVLIGGGTVLAYIGWQLLNEPSTPSPEKVVTRSDENVDSMAFFPLTMPVTAGPGCIAVAITLGAHSMHRSAPLADNMLSQIGNVIGLLLVGVIIYFCYRYTHYITRRLGRSGTEVIMRLAAFLNLCIGLQIIWHGVSDLMH